MNELETSAYYSFYVVAVDFNGKSEESEEAEFVVCLKPDHIDRPEYVESTKTTVTVKWTKPEYTGGCPIWTYRLWIDEGVTGTFAEVDPDNIKDRPYLTEYTITGLTKVSEWHEFKIEVVNEIGSVESLPLRVFLAAVPDTPEDLI